MRYTVAIKCSQTLKAEPGMVNVVPKSSEQKDAEAEVKDFKDDLGPFVVAAEQTRMAMVFTDATADENPIIFANDSFLELTGYSRAEVLGQPFNFLMTHGTDDSALSTIRKQFEEDATGGAEIGYRRKDNSEFWAGVFISPVRDEEGSVVQYFASFVDLTKHKDNEIQSGKLIDELNHRVKNTLATVQSIVWQALRTGSDPKEIREAIEGRLFAMSRSHDLLTRENWEHAKVFDVIHDALAPFSAKDGDSERIVVGLGEDVLLNPKSALAIGIALNELVTNAAKHGALSNDTGRLHVQWAVEKLDDGRRLVLSWQEIGGPLVAPPTRKGFGSHVLGRGLARELNADVKLDYNASGLQCTINIPLDGERHA